MLLISYVLFIKFVYLLLRLSWSEIDKSNVILRCCWLKDFIWFLESLYFWVERLFVSVTSEMGTMSDCLLHYRQLILSNYFKLSCSWGWGETAFLGSFKPRVLSLVKTLERLNECWNSPFIRLNLRARPSCARKYQVVFIKTLKSCGWQVFSVNLFSNTSSHFVC